MTDMMDPATMMIMMQKGMDPATYTKMAQAGMSPDILKSYAGLLDPAMYTKWLAASAWTPTSTPPCWRRC
jgi:hypothetical protein